MISLPDILQIAVVISRVVFFALLAMFLGICRAISSSMANSVKFSAIFLLSEAELVPRASRRMGVEEQILPVLGKHSGIVF